MESFRLCQVLRPLCIDIDAGCHRKHQLNASTSFPEPKTPAKTAATELLHSSYRRPSSSRTICGDRFIPSRSSSNFAFFDLPNSNSDPSSDDSYYAYVFLLKSALFGPECVGAATGFQPSIPEKSFLQGRFGGTSHSNYPHASPTNCNIFEYKTETRKSLHSFLPFGFDDHLPGVSHSPVKVPRKVPRSPCKVLDAPALQDDFYLKLVDWSSQNVLAVGLGNCVDLWHASSCKSSCVNWGLMIACVRLAGHIVVRIWLSVLTVESYSYGMPLVPRE